MGRATMDIKQPSESPGWGVLMEVGLGVALVSMHFLLTSKPDCWQLKSCA